MKIAILLIFITYSTYSQVTPKEEPFVRCLSLQMTGRKKNVHFFEGDNIKVKLQDHKKYKLQIVRLTDSSFFYAPYEDFNTVFDLKEVKFKDITKVYISNGTQVFAMKGFGALGSAGLLLSTIDILNQIRTGQTIKINPTIAGVSAGLIGLSFAVKLLTKEHYKINKKHFFHLYHLKYSSPLLKPN